MRSIIYLWLEVKKSLMFVKRIWMTFCLVLLLLTAGIVVVTVALQKANVLTKVNVALLIPESEQETKTVADLAASLESIKSVCNILYYDDEEIAMRDLKEETLQALVVFPDHFYEDANEGINTPAKVYVLEQPGTSELLFRNMLKDGVSLLQTAEAGVYASLDTAKIYEARMSSKKIGDLLMYQYVKKLLVRDVSFSKTVVSPIGTWTVSEYLFAALLMLAIFFPGLSLGYFYHRRQQAMERQLALLGIDAWRLSLIRVAVIGHILWLGFLSVYLIGCAVSSRLNLSFAVFDWQTVCGGLLLCMAVACVDHGIYGRSGDVRTAAVIVLFADLFLILGSDLVIPQEFLPDWLRGFCAVIHLSAWSDFLTSFLYRSFDVKSGIVILLYAVGFFLLGVYGLWKNTWSG